LFDEARKDYGRRSKVAHGEGSTVKRDEWLPLMLRAEEWVRVAAVRILKSNNLLDTFGGSARRDVFFQDLVLSGGLIEPTAEAAPS
jgi:hypothetical protein